MDSDAKSVLVTLVLCKLAVMLGLFLGASGERADMQKEAIKNNAAEWRIDPKTGEKKFVWITAEEHK